jgi:hypothetical protein
MADSEQEISQQMKRLAEKPDYRLALGQAGQKAYFADYRNDRVVDAFVELLQ